MLQFLLIFINDNRTACLTTSLRLWIVLSLNSVETASSKLSIFVIFVKLLQIFDYWLIFCAFLEFGIMIFVMFRDATLFHIVYYYNTSNLIYTHMEILALIGIIYFLVGACVCLLICVNPNDPGPLGKARRVMFTSLPNAFS